MLMLTSRLFLDTKIPSTTKKAGIDLRAFKLFNKIKIFFFF